LLMLSLLVWLIALAICQVVGLIMVDKYIKKEFRRGPNSSFIIPYGHWPSYCFGFGKKLAVFNFVVALQLIIGGLLLASVTSSLL